MAHARSAGVSQSGGRQGVTTHGEPSGLQRLDHLSGCSDWSVPIGRRRREKTKKQRKRRRHLSGEEEAVDVGDAAVAQGLARHPAGEFAVEGDEDAAGLDERDDALEARAPLELADVADDGRVGVVDQRRLARQVQLAPVEAQAQHAAHQRRARLEAQLGPAQARVVGPVQFRHEPCQFPTKKKTKQTKKTTSKPKHFHLTVFPIDPLPRIAGFRSIQVWNNR